MNECMAQEDAEKMSNQQAVNILKPLKDMMRDQHGYPISDAYFALEKAITVLTAESKKGAWIEEEDGGFVECPFCHTKTQFIENIEDLHFCFWCGADMRGDSNETN